MNEPINPARDAIEANLRGRPCPCCRKVNKGRGDDLDQAECPCRWWWYPWSQTWCRWCNLCRNTHCKCGGGSYEAFLKGM